MANRTNRTAKRKDIIVDRLRQGVSIYAAASAAGIARSTYYEWRDDDAEFARRADEAIEAGTDILEDVLLTMALRGNVVAILNTLKARRRSVWGDRHEHSGPGGGPIRHDHTHRDLSGFTDDEIASLAAIVRRRESGALTP